MSGFHLETAQARLLDSASVKDDAWDALVEKLKDGKKVGRCDLHDLLDNEMNSDRYSIVRDDLMQILTAQDDSRAHLADQFVEGMVERYLDAHPELIEEEAAEIVHGDDEEAELQKRWFAES